MLPDFDEIVRSTYGCWALALNRPRAIESFDRSNAGVVRSFVAAMFVAPTLLVDDLFQSHFTFSVGVFLDWIGFLFLYCNILLLFAVFCSTTARWFGAFERVTDFIVVSNWLGLPTGYITFIIGLFISAETDIAPVAASLNVIVSLGVLVVLCLWAARLLKFSALGGIVFVLSNMLSAVFVMVLFSMVVENSSLIGKVLSFIV